jgi:hypothetical protein
LKIREARFLLGSSTRCRQKNGSNNSQQELLDDWTNAGAPKPDHNFTY